MRRTRDLARTAVPVLVTALLAAALVGTGPVGVGPSANAAKRPPAPVPAAKTFGPVVDDQPSWERESSCSPTQKPGAKALRKLLARTYGPIASSTVRACSRADSGHEEGRAVDWMVSARKPAQKALGDAFVAWLQAPDSLGNPAAMARRLGVQYLIWNSRTWRDYDPARGWTEYARCLHAKMRKKAYDNTCHRTHVHISLTWDGAYKRTSYFGKYVACPVFPSPLPGYPAAADGLGTVALTPARLLGTVRGIGTPLGPCRLHGARRFDLPVLGRGGVPAAGVANVVLRVSLVRPDTNATLRVWPTGTATPVAAVLSTTVDTTATTTVTVPVGSNGSVSLQSTGGVAHATVDVLGYDNAAPVPAPPFPGAA